MRLIGVKSCIYILKVNVENNGKNPNFNVGDHVRILK